MIRAALFDLDGTLNNTLDDIADAMNWALAKNGLPEWPVDRYRYMVGNGARKLSERAVGNQKDLVNAVHRDYQARYETHNLVKTQPYPGIPELLRALAEQGLQLCVLSNKPDADTRHVITHFFPDIPFAIVRGQKEGVPLKPDPTAALQIASELGLSPSDFVYLGDTSVDMECARNAGMLPVGVLWGFRDEKELRESGAKWILSRPSELLTHLKEEKTMV